MREFFGRIQEYAGLAREAIMPNEKIRYVNYFLTHACNQNCGFCRAKNQIVKVMTREERREGFRRLRLLTSKHPIMSIIGGEPTLLSNLLIEAIMDAKEFGFMVSLVTNAYGLDKDESLIDELAKTGLNYLAISVDCDNKSQRTNLDSALRHLSKARKLGIVPAVNTVLTRQTNTDIFKQFANEVIKNNIFISPLICSPCVPGGSFSNAPPEFVPTNQQFREIVPWLMKKKLTTGLVTSSFGYLNQMLHMGQK